jgi:hypothetical protein
VSWVKKFIRPKEEYSSDRFPKRSVRQVVIFQRRYGQYFFGERVVVVHLETEATNQLYLLLNGEWTENDYDSREIADSLMAGIMQEPEGLKEAGLITPDSDVSEYVVSFGAGFGSKHYADGQDDTLHMALVLSEKVEAGWIPSEISELDDIYDLFDQVPLLVGYYSPFKKILKALTESFMDNREGMTLEFASRFAGALGRGYSLVEARLARGQKAPNGKFGSEILVISSLPALNGFRFPRIATLQYLSRKGLRLLKYLETESDTLTATRFKVNFLSGLPLFASGASAHLEEAAQRLAQQGADEQAYMEVLSKFGRADNNADDYSLKYQQILSYILFGDTGLARKDKAARKVILGPRAKRHEFEFGEDYFTELSKSSKDVYADWIGSSQLGFSLHAPIARHALAISKGIPTAEFPWTVEIAKQLINSESKNLQREVLSICDENPDWKDVITSDTLLKLLTWVEVEWIELVFRLTEQRNYYSYYYGNFTFDDWAKQFSSKPMGKRDVQIAIQILKGNYSQETRAALLFQLIGSNKLPATVEFDSFAQFSFRYWSPEDFFGFFGVKANEGYPIGVVDVMKLDEGNLSAYIIGIFASAVTEMHGYDSWNEALDALSKSKKPGVRDLLEEVFHHESIEPESMRRDILIALNQSAPTGNSLLNVLAKLVKRNQTKTVLEMLEVLGEESFAPFWRKNAKEVEQILGNSQSLAKNYWEGAETLSLAVRERIEKYPDFGPKVIAAAVGSISRMNSFQEQLLVKEAIAQPGVFEIPGLLKAMLIAPSLEVNSLATEYVKKSGLLASYWLLMLESNLPAPHAAALSYLESQLGKQDFVDSLLMALDSNNQQARTSAIKTLASVKDAESLKKVLTALVENRNSDTWSIVSENLKQLDDPAKFQEFTRKMFLSRRTARNVKEKVKLELDSFIGEIESAVEKDTLIRMAFSSVTKDREWALKQIALHQLDISGVSVQYTWNSGSNV